ncbi:MAG TPA: response regulator transcription factor [Burkholderiaceae bacterium]|nr:response regulator transcription factor [Burkholderiaceae bacterium]
MRFLIVDDHPLVREALGNVVRSLRPDASIDEASTAAQALVALRDRPTVDLVLLDLRLPDRPGMELLPIIAAQHVGTAVVVLSGDLDKQTVQRALAAGAVGCIPKTEPREVIASALGLVLAGGVYVPPLAVARGEPQSAAGPWTAHRAGERGAPSPSDLGLTGRQVEVLALLMQGKNNKLICRALGLAEPTVKSHVSAILRVLNVDSRTEAVLAVTRLGWSFPSLPHTR